MFGSQRRAAGASATTDAPMRYHREVAVVADPDDASIKRVRALNHQLGVGLQGGAGTVVGYDRGEPGHALSAIVARAPDPTAAMTRVSRPADAQTLRSLSDDYHQVPSINSELDPTAAAFWARLGR